MSQFFSAVISTTFGYSILRVSTPIIFASLSALLSDRVGILNMGIEGIMLSAAFIGVVVSAATLSAWIGLLSAAVLGIVLGLLFGFVTLRLKANSLLSGISINLIASSATVFLLYEITGERGVSSSLKSFTLPNVDLPVIKSVPVLGAILSGHNVLTYLSIICVVVLYVFLFKTRLGMRIRSVGENEEAAKSVGVDTQKVKYIALCLSGLLAGLGGAFLSMGYISMFSQNMTAGRGFIGIAASAMGSSSPVPAFFASLLFGTFDALANMIQDGRIPTELVQMIPYIATILGLTLMAARKISLKGKNARTVEKKLYK